MNLNRLRMIIAALVLGVAACSSSDGRTAGTLPPVTTANTATTVAVPSHITVPRTTTTVPVPTAASSLPPSTSTLPPPATATTTPLPPATTASAMTLPPPAALCGGPLESITAVSQSYGTLGPQTNPGLIGFEAELGDHICFERFVITLQPSPTGVNNGQEPGWLVTYDPNLEFCHDRSGQSPAVGGTHFFCVIIGSMLVTVPDNGGLREDMRAVSHDDDLIVGAALVESDDVQSRFLVGLNGEHHFRVRTLQNPYRLYVDFGLEKPAG